MVKLNWDASVDIKTKMSGLGVVIRDTNGSFLAAFSKRIHTEVSPVVAETLAALHAVLFCSEMGYSKAWFEGDALQVVNEVNSPLPCDSMHGHLIQAIKEGLQGLNQTSFTHTKREANAVAHEPAVEARTHVMDTVRWNSIPPCICGIVRREEIHPSL
jgi:ribonuclease HI